MKKNHRKGLNFDRKRERWTKIKSGEKDRKKDEKKKEQ